MQRNNDEDMNLNDLILATHQEAPRIDQSFSFRMFARQVVHSQWTMPVLVCLAVLLFTEKDKYACPKTFANNETDNNVNDETGQELVCLLKAYAGTITGTAALAIWNIRNYIAKPPTMSASAAYLDLENRLNDKLTELEKKFDTLSDDYKCQLVNLGMATQDDNGDINLKFVCPIKLGLIATPLSTISSNGNISIYEFSSAIQSGLHKRNADFQTTLPITELASSDALRATHRNYLLSLENALNRLTLRKDCDNNMPENNMPEVTSTLTRRF